jgi:hypothetical protein
MVWRSKTLCFFRDNSCFLWFALRLTKICFQTGTLKSFHHRGHGEHREGRQREVGYALNAGVAESQMSSRLLVVLSSAFSNSVFPLWLTLRLMRPQLTRECSKSFHHRGHGEHRGESQSDARGRFERRGRRVTQRVKCPVVTSLCFPLRPSATSAFKNSVLPL